MGFLSICQSALVLASMQLFLATGIVIDPQTKTEERIVNGLLPAQNY